MNGRQKEFHSSRLGICTCEFLQVILDYERQMAIGSDNNVKTKNNSSFRRPLKTIEIYHFLKILLHQRNQDNMQIIRTGDLLQIHHPSDEDIDTTIFQITISA